MGSSATSVGLGRCHQHDIGAHGRILMENNAGRIHTFAKPTPLHFPATPRQTVEIYSHPKAGVRNSTPNDFGLTGDFNCLLCMVHNGKSQFTVSFERQVICVY